MPQIELGRVFRAFTCDCADGPLWLEPPRHVTCTRCGGRILQVELVDRRVAEFYKYERDEARTTRS